MFGQNGACRRLAGAGRAEDEDEKGRGWFMWFGCRDVQYRLGVVIGAHGLGGVYDMRIDS